MKVSDNTAISMPMRNLLSILAAVGVGVWAYFGVIERLNTLETNNTLMQNDLEMNTEFRIKWPMGTLGSLPDDSEQFMLLEMLAGQVEKLEEQMENSMHNKVNIERNQKDIEKALSDVDKLKDKLRANGSTQ